MDVPTNYNLGYWLFYTQRCVAYAFAEVLRQYCEDHKKPYMITPPQWGALSLLWETGDGLTIGTISQKRGIDAPTVTGIIKRMEQSGLVERLHDREDRRVVKVFLTEEARGIMPTLNKAVAAFDVFMKQDFLDAEVQDMVTKLQRIVANLGLVAPNVGDRFGLLPGHGVETAE